MCDCQDIDYHATPEEAEFFASNEGVGKFASSASEADQLYDQLFEAVETLRMDTESMSDEEAEDYLTGEWVQAIIPVVTALAPVVARVVGKIATRRRSRPRSSPPRSRRSPAPVRRPSSTPAPASAPPVASMQLVNGLLQLLRDPRTIQALGQAVQAAATTSTTPNAPR